MYSNQNLAAKTTIRIMAILMILIIPLMADFDADGVDLIGRYPYGYCAFAVAAGDFVYSANGTVLEVLDVHTLQPVAEVVTESIVSSLSVSDNYVYIANWSDGFKVVDISDPTIPSIVAGLDFAGQCWDISVTGDFAYVGNNDEGLRIIDISNPIVPTLASTFLPTPAVKFEYTQVIDTIAYAATQSGLYILDVSEPTAPVQLGYSPAENGAWTVNVVDTIAYLPKMNDGIRMVNVADPNNPIELGYFQTPDAAFWVEVVDSIAYVAERFAGVQILDISDLTAPDSIGMLPLDYADALHIQGDSLYVASSSWGLKQVDISDLTSPVLVNECTGGGYPVDLHATDTITYVAMRGLGVGIFTYDEFSEPEMISLIEMSDPFRLHAEGDLLFVVGSYNLHIYDVSDPANPVHTHSTDTGGLSAVFSVGNLLYLGGYPDLQIFDISDPYFPILLGNLDGLPSIPNTIHVSGGLAFLTNRWAGLHIVNILDPGHPELLGVAPNFDDARAVHVAGEYAYVADSYLGLLKVIDVANPGNPIEVSSYSVGSPALDLGGLGRYAYVIDSWNGVRVIDCADPYNPIEVGYFDTGGYARAIFADNGQLHVADGGGGFYLLETEFKQPLFTVNSTGDASDAFPGDGICSDGSGDCTLRAAMEEANVYPGYDKIAFEIEGVGPHTIQPGSTLPAIYDPVFIDGTSEPDFSGNPIIELDGSIAGELIHGIRVYAGSSSIKGLVINNFGEYGIYLESNHNVIEGNYIGTDISGEIVKSNQIGVYVNGSYNRIGGIIDGAGNVISGNSSIQVLISYESFYEISNNVLQGNILGLNPAGNQAVCSTGWPIGIWIFGDGNTIGGSAPKAGNIISGNAAEGIVIRNDDPISNAIGNVIQGNLIGLDLSGTMAIGNGGPGIFIGNSSNVVGGINPGGRNIISGNGLSGIDIMGDAATGNLISGNFIGTDLTGTVAIPNMGSGVWIEEASDNIIGGLDSGAGNIISGNNFNGVSIFREEATGNQILGNFIGTDITGSEEIGNSTGVRLRAPGNFIGDAQFGGGNVISGNNTGIIIEWTIAENNLIQGNLIGLAADALSALGNALYGIKVDTYVGNNQIGGNGEGQGNTIAYNNSDGIWISAGTRIAIQSNAIYANGGLGIDLAPNGMTPNDAGDVDTGPNNLQNFPESLNVGVDDGGDLLIQYLVDSDLENSEYPIRVEFFLSDEDGEGQEFLYSNYYTADNHELGLKTIVLGPVINYDLEMGDYIVATAIDAQGNTSEFSHTTELTTYVGIAEIEALPTEFILQQNYPNPFNPTTNIRYGLPEASDVSLTIYDLMGRVVQRYVEQNRAAGWVNYEWSGRKNNGELVSTGVYLCRLTAGDYTKTIKMVYLK